MQLNLYLMKDENETPGTYDCWVVAARDERRALQVSPDPDQVWSTQDRCWMLVRADGGNEAPKAWGHPTVTRIGVADKDIKAGLICASFNPR